MSTMQLLAEEVIEQSSIAAVHESAVGPKLTFRLPQGMSAFGCKADIISLPRRVRL
jgi:hypothetical protein